MKLTKRQFGFLIILLFIVGAVINFYSMNMLMNTICNKGSPNFLLLAFPTLAMLTIAMEFVAAVLFLVRAYLHPSNFKKMMRTYGFILFSFSLVGLVSDIVSGTVVYHSFTISIPFAGGLIIFMLWHIIILVLGILMVLYYFYSLNKDKGEARKVTAKYVFISIFWSLVLFYGMNRLGAFVLSPSYITWTTLTDTYPFYLSLLLVPVILLNILMYVFNNYKKNNAIIGVFISSCIAVLSVFFTLQIIIRGRADQAFVSSISPALPIERLTTKPIDITLQCVSAIALALFTLNHSIVFKRLKDVETKKAVKARKK